MNRTIRIGMFVCALIAFGALALNGCGGSSDSSAGKVKLTIRNDQ